MDIDEKDVWGLLVSAFEGGSNYWIDHVRSKGIDHLTSVNYEDVDDDDDFDELRAKNVFIWHHQIPFLGGSVIFVESEGYNHNPKPLNRETITQGLQLMHDKAPRHWADFMSDPDAITGDVFLQLCIFGDIIYG